MPAEPGPEHDRQITMNRTPQLVAGLLVAVAILAACTTGAGPTASPSLRLVPSSPPVESPAPGESGSPAPSGGPVSSPDEAAQRVIEENPEFQGIGPKNPDMIGGCCWYEAAVAPGGFQVTMHVGWGDCPSGCIENHTWVYMVSQDGSVELVSEDGPSVPPGIEIG
jgi:hypothetical protein